jgi:hypothetical protein
MIHYRICFNLGKDNSLLAIFTLYVFLMTKEASARSTLEILTLGKGVNRESSEDVANSVVRIFKICYT